MMRALRVHSIVFTAVCRQCWSLGPQAFEAPLLQLCNTAPSCHNVRSHQGSQLRKGRLKP